jgi:hypothetical protein
MQSFDQTKIVLTLVRDWPYKNEVIIYATKKLKKLARRRRRLPDEPA